MACFMVFVISVGWLQHQAAITSSEAALCSSDVHGDLQMEQQPCQSLMAERDFSCLLAGCLSLCPPHPLHPGIRLL